MKLHLPLQLLSALLACCALVSAPAYALDLGANETITENTDWTENTNVTANVTLTINPDVTVTQETGSLVIGAHTLTIDGGGTLSILSTATEHTLAADGRLNIQGGSTLDLTAPDARLSVAQDANWTRFIISVADNSVLKTRSMDAGNYVFGARMTNKENLLLSGGDTIEVTATAAETISNIGFTVNEGGGSYLVTNAGTTVKMRLNTDKTIQVVLNDVLTLGGAGNIEGGDKDDMFTGNGGLKKVGDGTLTLGFANSFGGGVELNGGTLIVGHAGGMGTNKVLSVTGNAAIGGISAAYQGLSLSSGVTLDVSAVDAGAGLTLSGGSLSLGGQNTMTGNLNLGTGLFIDASHMTKNGDALLALNGSLTVNGSLLLENADDVSWGAGTYSLISATGGITGDLANTVLLGSQYIGNWDTADNVLKFVVTELTSISWTGGGDATWTVGGSGTNSPWSAGSTFENGMGVSFGDIAGNAPQTVNIAGQVNPGLILVNAESTDYTWTGTGSLTGSSKLQKTGNGTLMIATDNSGFSGEILLGGGVVEMQNAGALGTGNIIFNGGALKYGTGITADISGQLKTDALASNAILVDTNGNAVTWASLAGWTGTLTRSGEGSLTLGAGTYEGKLTNEGTGSLTIGAGNSSLTGGIGGTVSKTGDGTLTINRNAFTNSNGSTLIVESGTLSLKQDEAAWTGSMNIVLKDNVAMTVPYGVGVNGTGTLTMGKGTSLTLSNGGGTSGVFNMNIILDAAGGQASLSAGTFGNNTSVGSTISGTGDLKITHINSNQWKFTGGWVKNSYDGNTEIIATDKNINLTYDVGNASVTSGQTVTPWGKGNVTIGGGAGTIAVTFSGLNSNAAMGGVALDGDITLKGVNAATRLNIFTGASGNMVLNGKVSVETSGSGTAMISSGDMLRMEGGLGGTGTLAVNTRNNVGALTLGGDVSGFSGTLNLTGSNLYLDADTALAGTLNASSAKVTALRSQNVTGTLNAASLAVDGTALSADGAVLTVANLALGADAGVSLNIDGNVAEGTYTLVGWDTLTSGNFVDANSMTLTGTLAGLYQGTFTVDTAGKTVSVSVSMADGVIVWDGNPIGAVDNTKTYLFDGTHTGAVSLTGSMDAKAIYFNNGAGQDLALTNNEGELAGNGTITKLGEGKVSFNSSNENYAGAVNIQEGTVAVTANKALGTGTVTVAGEGTLEIGVGGNITDILGETMPVVNGGTLAFTSGVEVTLNKILDSGTGANLEVTGEGTTLNLLNDNPQRNIVSTYVGTGSILSITATNTMNTLLSGSLTVNGGSLNTDGDSFGYTGATLGSLTLQNGAVWTLTGTKHNTLNTLNLTMDASSVLVNTSGNGFYVLNGSHRINTLSSASGMSVFTSNGEFNNNKMTISGATAFNIARGNFALDDTSTADLKIDVIVQGGSNITKTGDGVLQLTRANTYSGQTLLKEGTLLLTGAATLGNGAGAVTLGGNGDAFLTFAVDGDRTVGNAIGGTGTFTQKGSGIVTLGGANTYTGITSVEAGTLKAGSATAFGTSSVSLSSGTLAFLAGADGYKGALNITGGELQGGQYYSGASKNVTVNAAAGVSSISLGGLNGSSLKSIGITDAGTVISGINGAASLDSANLVVGTDNVAKTQDLAGSDSIIQFNENGATLDIASLTLSLSADVVNAMQGWGAGERTAWLNLTNGSLSYGTATFNPLLEGLGFTVTGINGGSIGITGDATQIYAVGSEDKEITSNAELDPYRAVIVDGNLALNLPGVDDEAEGLTINNLSGAASGVITITATDDKTASVILNNELLGNDPNTSGPDTKYAGTINGGTANITKTGAGSLELSGSLNTDGALDMREGSLTLSGTADLGSIVLDSREADSLSTLNVIGTATAGTLTDEGNGGTLNIGGDGKLTLDTAGSELSNSTVTGSGTLQVADNASLLFNGTSKLDGVQVELSTNGMLELGNAANSLSGLTGNGSLNNGSALEITASGKSVFEGSLTGEGSITMNGTGTQTLKGSGSAGQSLNVTKGTLELMGAEGGNGSVTYKTLTAGTGGHVRLTAVGDGVDAVNTTLTVGNGLNLAGANLDLVINTNRDDLFANPVITVLAGDVNLNGTTVSLDSLGDYDDPADPTANLNFTLVDAQGAGGTVTADGASVTSSGYFDFYYQELGIRAEGGKIIVSGMVKTDNAFMDAADTANSAAGANLLWNNRGNAPKGTVLGDLREAVRNDIQSGNAGQAARSMAASAGSTVNALGTAQRDALREQMGWIRNRTNQMGVNPAYINEDLPYFHMWMEGTGSYAQLDTRGDESGYKLTTWGGTFGVDVDLSDSFTMGAAFTANYGDLTASAADTADGHLDSYYANLFGRYQSKRWAHTLILTGGWNDAKLNRTVDYGAGSYRTQGNTNGWGMGAMYELTYDIYLNENRSSILQPLFNASVVTTRMDGYRETGAGNAGLSVDKQEWTTGTLALGGRWMGLVGSNIFGREALAELRINAAQDLGDDRGETSVGFLANPGYTQQVRGAKVGRTALQIGAGLSVPVGTQGTVFVNGNADIRNGASSVNGSIGYRYDF